MNISDIFEAPEKLQKAQKLKKITKNRYLYNIYIFAGGYTDTISHHFLGGSHQLKVSTSNPVINLRYVHRN